MTAQLILGSGSTATSSLAYTTIDTDVDYQCDGDVDIVTVQKDCTITLDPNPIKGRNITVAAAKGVSVTITGGAFPIIDGDVLETSGRSVECTFVGEGWAVHGTASTILTASDVYINPITGNDINSGTSAFKPLKTYAEFARRVGVYGSLRPVGGIMTVHVQKDLPVSDPVSLLAQCPPNTVLVHDFAQKSVGSGTIIAVTPLNRAANQAWEIQSVGIGAHVGRRIQLTTGPNAGFSFFVVKDLGGNKARISPSVFVDTPQNFNGLYFGPPAPGDKWTAFDATQCTYGIFDVKFAFADDTLPSSAQFRGARFRPSAIYSAVYCPSQFNFFINCTFDAGLLVEAGGGNTCLNSCFLTTAPYVQQGGSLAAIYAGGFIETGCILEGGANLVLDGDVILQGGFADPNTAPVYMQTGSYYYGGFVGIFEAPFSGVRVEAEAAYWCRTTPVGFGGQALYGKNQGGLGVEVRSRGTLTFENPADLTITGGGGDFALGGYTAVRPFNDATGTYAAAVATTWPNLAAVTPGGFGQNAINPVNGAAVVLNT